MISDIDQPVEELRGQRNGKNRLPAERIAVDAAKTYHLIECLSKQKETSTNLIHILSQTIT